MQGKKESTRVQIRKNGKKIADIEQVMERDRYFSAEEAVEFGLIDKIVESRKV